jgi:hypothetical protein
VEHPLVGLVSDPRNAETLSAEDVNEPDHKDDPNERGQKRD